MKQNYGSPPGLRSGELDEGKLLQLLGRYARNRLQNRDKDVEDLVMDTFAALVSQGKRAPWLDHLAWGRSILNKKIAEFFRNQKVRAGVQSLEEDYAEFGSPDVHQQVEGRLMIEAGLRAFQDMAPQEQGVIYTRSEDHYFGHEVFKPVNFAFLDWRLHPNDERRPDLDPERREIWGQDFENCKQAPEYAKHCLPKLREKARKEWGS